MSMTRRHFAQGLAAVAAAGATPMVFAADTVKIGYVSPQTGALSVIEGGLVMKIGAVMFFTTDSMQPAPLQPPGIPPHLNVTRFGSSSVMGIKELASAAASPAAGHERKPGSHRGCAASRRRAIRGIPVFRLSMTDAGAPSIRPHE